MTRAAALAVLLTLLSPPAPAAPRGSLRVRVGGYAGQALARAAIGALARLESRECASILTDFRDALGNPLADRVAAMGLDAASYLELVVLADGAGQAPCRRSDVLAVTTPGSRVVYVCAERFRALAVQEPGQAEAILIHEMLHSLGLGEDPPTSREITARVLERCGAVSSPDA